MTSKRLPGRFKSAFVDLIVWTIILFLVFWATEKLARAGLRVPIPTGPEPRDIVSLVSYGFAALCANAYLAISAAVGRSVGKALLGLRLVVADRSAKPGLARGLVRSSLQAGPWMGALMVLTGAHDAFAGTRIVTDEQGANDHTAKAVERKPQVAAWKVALAVALHLFAAFVYMVVGAI